MDHTQQSRELVDRFGGSRYFQIVQPRANYASIDDGSTAQRAAGAG